MAWYRAGTATFTNGSTAVTGSGTAWTTNVRPGDEIIGPDNISREVETVTSDTALTMVESYAGTTAAAAAYKVKPIQGWNRDVAAQLAALINDYGSIEAALTAVAGNVGIGTLTPQSALSVATTGDAAAAAFGEAGSPTGKVLSLGYFATSDYGRIQAVHQGTGFRPLALNPSGGNVGIGTTAPQQKLHVGGGLLVGGAATLPSATGPGLFSYEGPVMREYIGDATGYSRRWSVRTGSTTFDRVTITDAGNFGINTTSPTAKLHVNGTVRFDIAVTATNSGPGGADALPAAPAGYAIISIGGTDRKIPYYP